jgi:hypothetical protein
LAFQILKNCKIYLDGYDLTGYSNKVGLKYSANILDDTVFGADSKSRVAGLKDVQMEGSGFFEANADSDASDDAVNAKFAVADTLLTLGPTGGAAGEVGFFFKSLLAEYAPGAAVGELFAFDINAGGCDLLCRGTFMENGAKTSTANGTARQLGAVTADQKVYAGLHIVAVSGTNPTLDLTIESDDAEAFTDPTTKITFSQKTAIGAEYATPVAGEIDDDWWRAAWTIGGTDPSFTVVVIVAIQ